MHARKFFDNARGDYCIDLDFPKKISISVYLKKQIPEEFAFQSIRIGICRSDVELVGIVILNPVPHVHDLILS